MGYGLLGFAIFASLNGLAVWTEAWVVEDHEGCWSGIGDGGDQEDEGSDRVCEHGCMSRFGIIVVFEVVGEEVADLGLVRIVWLETVEGLVVFEICRPGNTTGYITLSWNLIVTNLAVTSLI